MDLASPSRAILTTVHMHSADMPTRADEEGPDRPPPSTGPSQMPLDFSRRSRPLILSRYILLGQLGSGGTSMVYKAYDPELDRRVALKLLQTSGGIGNRARTRLVREAQAMARLTHPNVVTAYDVAAYSELDLGLDPSIAPPEGLEIPSRGVFIVMEMVEGCDLRRWLNRRHRGWQAVLEVMLGAGRGLAAAHEVGIVHRDFKPGNVLIGDDGRVLVSDFGLARAAIPSSSSAPEEDPGGRAQLQSSSWDDLSDPNLTKTGAVLGTPPYMSPEQHRGAGSDPRTDQFAFGVTLYEALFGVRPFAGSIAEMRQAKERGGWRPIPTSTRIPKRLVAVIERTLAPTPEARYPTMDELIEALERARRSRVTPRLVMGAAALITAATIPIVVVSRDDPCAAASSHVQQVWNEDRREQLQAAFEASSASYAQAASQRVQSGLDRWTQRWEEAYRDACEATHVRHEQSQKGLDLRVACLSRQLQELDSLTALMLEHDPRVIENAVISVQSLPEIEPCADVAALMARVEPPASPQDRARVEAGYGGLSEAHAHELAGRYEEAVTLAREVSTEAEAIGYFPLHASAQLRMATALQLMGDLRGAEEHFLSAIWSAERSRDEATAADAWIALVWVVGVERNQPEPALRWVKFAEAALDRFGHNRARKAMLDHNRAGVYYRMGRYSDALTHYQRALTAQREHYGPQHPLVARTLNHIGNVLIMQGSFQRAREYCEQALEIRRQVLGEKHPHVAAPYNNLAELLTRQRRYEEALTYANKALEITRGTGRPEEIIAWILVARQHGVLHNDEDELEARRRVIALLDGHPSFDQSTRDEHLKRIDQLVHRTQWPDPAPPTARPRPTPPP